MKRWKALPDDLEPEATHLVRELRGLKDLTELTLAALASRTPYSKSAWERYFNGKKLPPRQAVTALAEIAGPEHVTRLLELWQRAAHAQARSRPQPEGDLGATTGDASAAEDRADDPLAQIDAGSGGDEGASDEGALLSGLSDGSGRRTRRRILVGACAAGAALLTAVALVVHAVTQQQEPQTPGSEGVNATAASAPHLAAGQSEAPVGCRKEVCEGKDPQRMGCGQDARTAASVWLSDTLIELRYSSRCQAAWGRILAAKVDDQVHVDAVNQEAQTGRVKFGVDAYSPMIPVTDPSEARACATLKEKTAKCTPYGSSAVVSPHASSGG